jgi:antagonist of KipI
MSIEIVKAGVSDTFQDGGRFGFQHLGINPSGAMDLVSMKVANFLVGNDENTPAIEFCFPASSLRFHTNALIALSGADFGATINGIDIPINQVICVPAQSILVFKKIKQGTYCYLACNKGFKVKQWLGSTSTNTKVMAGGYNGRSLQKGDFISFVRPDVVVEKLMVLKWKANVSDFYNNSQTIQCTAGNEFNDLTKKSQTDFQKKRFKTTHQRDRMGYLLSGPSLQRRTKSELLSTGVNFGTLQLLPTGQLICLMADHQTTGGYPRIAHVLSSFRTNFVQMKVNQEFSFELVSLEDAEQTFRQQESNLAKLKVACSYAINEFYTKQ